MQALQKYYGYHTAVIDLRNPTRSDGDNMLHLVNKYMDEYLADHTNTGAKAKAEKYAKITAKTIISPVVRTVRAMDRMHFSMMRQKAC